MCSHQYLCSSVLTNPNINLSFSLPSGPIRKACPCVTMLQVRRDIRKGVMNRVMEDLIEMLPHLQTKFIILNIYVNPY